MHRKTKPFSCDDSKQVFLDEKDIDEIIDLNMESKDDTNKDDEEGDINEITSMESINDEEENSEETSDKIICIFRDHKNASVFCGSLNTDGSLAVTGGQDDRAYVWKTTAKPDVYMTFFHTDSVVFADFNHDGTYVATGDMSGLIQVTRVIDKQLIWKHNIGDLTWMQWHPLINVVIAGTESGQIYMWKVPQDDCKIFHGYGISAEIGTFFQDGNRLAVGYNDGTIRILDVKNTKVLCTIPSKVGHCSLITAIDCYIDNNLIISTSLEGKTILSTAKNGKIICMLQCFDNDKMEVNTGECDDSNACVKNWAETAAFCKDPTFPVAVTGTVTGHIYIWDISKQMLRQQINLDTGITKYNGITKILWNRNTTMFFVVDMSGMMLYYDGKTGNCLEIFKGHTNTILDLSISKDGNKALTSSDDFTARIFDISSLH